MLIILIINSVNFNKNTKKLLDWLYKQIKKILLMMSNITLTHTEQIICDASLLINVFYNHNFWVKLLKIIFYFYFRFFHFEIFNLKKNIFKFQIFSLPIWDEIIFSRNLCKHWFWYSNLSYDWIFLKLKKFFLLTNN